MLTSREIRQQYLDYFVRDRGHTFVPSSPVVPHEDPTLLFTNAGMNQFKDVFLATGKRPYTRAANSQKCIRAGGKHNDLEDVGRDTYHHTFFEMLGNWSFGDYFKAEAIEWAWELLTDRWGLPRDRLHATVFAGGDGVPADEEAIELWKTRTDIDPSHIGRWGKKDNFWEMGDTGPCGPCTEIHVDLTPDKTGGHLVNKGTPRVIEIWNLVFIQFNRDAGGKLHPLPARHVDTGMGFERVTAVLQGKSSNYDTDVFAPLFAAIRDVTKARPYGGSLEDRVDTAYRVIGDHIRTLTIALTDGAVPSNEGRGSVLRRILRRAVRHGWQTLGMTEPFLHRLVPSVVETMGDAFPELRKDPDQVAGVIQEEEVAFGRTIDRGIALFDMTVEKLGAAGKKEIPGEAAFHLHDTFGFPIDLTQVMAGERGLTVDEAGFEARMKEAKEKARGVAGAADVGTILVQIVQRETPKATEFTGYDAMEGNVSSGVAVYALSETGYESVKEAAPGTRVAVIAPKTPFYGESGGQVGDRGTIRGPKGGVVEVEDTQSVGGIHFHLGTVKETFRATRGKYGLEVDEGRRRKIMANHTATHVLNHKLRKVLGEHVQQKGSLVDDSRTRFDFSHKSALSPKEIAEIERLVGADVEADLPVHAGLAPQEAALKIHGLRAVFGEKYPPTVRVVSIGPKAEELLAEPGRKDWYESSVEFCGGTHVASTAAIGRFVLVSEEAVAKGVRRVVGITGEAAKEAVRQGEALVQDLARLEKADPAQVAGEVGGFLARVQEAGIPLVARDLLREGLERLKEVVKKLRKEEGKETAGRVVDEARRIADGADGHLVVARLDGVDAKSLRTAMDVIRSRKPDAALLLGSVDGDKVAFLAAVPEALVARGLKAGDWVREVAKVAGGSGGGKPDMAQAGGKDPAKLDDALEVGRTWASAKL